MKNLLLLCLLLSFAACKEETKVTEVNTTTEVVPSTTTSATPEKLVQQENSDTTTASAVLTAEKVRQDVAEAPEKAAVKKEEKPKIEKKRGEITFASKKWNFGDIKEGDIVNHDFKFKNTGSGPLEVKNVTASCGCTQPSFPFLPVAPGEEGTISVTFNSTGKINEQRPTVSVTTNGTPSSLTLSLEGMVRARD